MPTHVALLRGINLGGHNKVAMADLRTVVASLGHGDVATYIQSGNVVFGSRGSSLTELTDRIEECWLRAETLAVPDQRRGGRRCTCWWTARG